MQNWLRWRTEQASASALRAAEMDVIEMADVLHDHLTPETRDTLLNDLFKAVRKHREAFQAQGEIEH